MKAWLGTIVIVGVAAMLVSRPANAASRDAQRQASVPATDLGARRHARAVFVRPAPLYAPHYYARPVHYRPYPYGVPAPFVLSYGPWW